MTHVKLAEIKQAYIKLKSYTYYENFSIGLKSKLAQFESKNLEVKLQRLAEDLNHYISGEEIQTTAS